MRWTFLLGLVFVSSGVAAEPVSQDLVLEGGAVGTYYIRVTVTENGITAEPIDQRLRLGDPDDPPTPPPPVAPKGPVGIAARDGRDLVPASTDPNTWARKQAQLYFTTAKIPGFFTPDKEAEHPWHRQKDVMKDARRTLLGDRLYEAWIPWQNHVADAIHAEEKRLGRHMTPEEIEEIWIDIGRGLDYSPTAVRAEFNEQFWEILMMIIRLVLEKYLPDLALPS